MFFVEGRKYPNNVFMKINHGLRYLYRTSGASQASHLYWFSDGVSPLLETQNMLATSRRIGNGPCGNKGRKVSRLYRKCFLTDFDEEKVERRYTIIDMKSNKFRDKKSKLEGKKTKWQLEVEHWQHTHQVHQEVETRVDSQ